jgi:very-short-patch-repair endonuclease
VNAQNLRKNMTDEEKHLWYDFLKKLPITVNRQKNIGNYIVDFYIASKRLVIELDGSQHNKPEHRVADKERDATLDSLGVTVLRYTNLDIHERFGAVCKDILNHLDLSLNDLRS